MGLEELDSLMIVKRDGRLEKYDTDKLYKVVLWACDGDQDLASILIDSLSIKINDRMTIQSLYDEVINTAVNMISPIQRGWDQVAANLYLMQLYKESYNLKTTGYYPNYADVVAAGIISGNYNNEVFNSFTTEELHELGDIINPDYDLKFSYKGLYVMNSKYCIREKNKPSLELPQHAYLRMAIYSYYKEHKSVRIELIRNEYKAWASHLATAGTPRILNSGTPRSQLASCVLSTLGDDTENITDTDRNLAIYSKNSGGLALDISLIRSSGSKISGNSGVSSGPVPFVKKIESTVSAFNQNGKRTGACVITFPFWHADVHALLPLKDAGGAEDHRARKLKYSMRVHDIFKERVKKNEYVTLFNPMDVPLLNSTWGEEFTKAYIEYESRNDISKKRVKARDLIYEYKKFRKETGDVYGAFIDNINIQNIVGTYVGSSNLCQEITISSFPSKDYTSNLVTTEDGTNKIISSKTSGEIGLCNLFSINLLEWDKLSYHDKLESMYALMRGADNVIDYQYYPIKEAKTSNIKKRPIGIGVTNYAALLALKEIKWTDDEALKYTHEVFEELYFIVYSVSNILAKERGPFEFFRHTRWAEGLTPLDLSILHKLDKPELNYPLKHDWEDLKDRIRLHGMRFSLHGAIAPTATSGIVINATESIDPITDLFVLKDGTQTLPSLVPHLNKRAFYQNAYTIGNKRIIELAAIRQKFLDQSQSLNTYYKDPNDAKEQVQDMFLAMELGVKTFYYMKSPKLGENVDEVCESCT